MNVIDKGTEGNISWELIETDESRKYEIVVDSETKKISKEYTCEHPVLFGLDFSDLDNINQILDRLIEEVKEG